MATVSPSSLRLFEFDCALRKKKKTDLKYQWNESHSCMLGTAYKAISDESCVKGRREARNEEALPQFLLSIPETSGPAICILEVAWVSAFGGKRRRQRSERK